MDPTDQASLRTALRENFLFKELNDYELNALGQNIWVEQVPAGSKIVREGEEADALYVVLAGGVNVQKGDGQFLSYLGPGGFFGEMGLFMSGLLRTADCVCALDTTCAVLRKDVLHQFCDSHPVAGLKVYRTIIGTLAERLQATSADLATLMSAQLRSQSEISDLVDRAKAKRESSGGA